jgi:hypothetical protein
MEDTNKNHKKGGKKGVAGHEMTNSLAKQMSEIPSQEQNLSVASSLKD